MSSDNYKLGSFRLLAKLHKPSFSWRPIVNCRNHPTSKISNLMENLLKPLVQLTGTVLKDSQNLIHWIFPVYIQIWIKFTQLIH